LSTRTIKACGWPVTSSRPEANVTC
jgi:hypothetical protein